jgi:hypothetical protein
MATTTRRESAECQVQSGLDARDTEHSNVHQLALHELALNDIKKMFRCSLFEIKSIT